MSELKLFVSHSSRLDDVEHLYPDKDRNWKLLEATCRAIKRKYGRRVDVLVDRDGLIPGEDWNHQLNLWLAECHVAIILFSRRAIEKSLWVAKEAAILSWRAELDHNFTLIPVLLDGETQPEDLARDFLGVLKIDQNQCIRNARSAKDIVNGIAKKLGKPEDLIQDTPLDHLQEGISKLLQDGTTTRSLKRALNDVGYKAEPDGRPERQRYADALARCLVTATSGNPLDYFKLFQRGVDPLEPTPARDWVERLFRQIRAFWVDPRSAACIPLALQHRTPIILSGVYVNRSVPQLEAKTGYTLERYIERAWPSSKKRFDPVSLTRFDTLEQIQDEIRRRLLPLPLILRKTPEELDGYINEDEKKLFVIVPLVAEQDESPDAQRLAVLAQLISTYKNIVVILHTATEWVDPLGNVVSVKPPLDPKLEDAALAKESLVQLFVNQFGDH